MKQQNLNPYPVDTPAGSLEPGAIGEYTEPVAGLTEIKTRGKASKAQEGSD